MVYFWTGILPLLKNTVGNATGCHASRQEVGTKGQSEEYLAEK